MYTHGYPWISMEIEQSTKNMNCSPTRLAGGVLRFKAMLQKPYRALRQCCNKLVFTTVLQGNVAKTLRSTAVFQGNVCLLPCFEAFLQKTCVLLPCFKSVSQKLSIIQPHSDAMLQHSCV